MSTSVTTTVTVNVAELLKSLKNALQNIETQYQKDTEQYHKDITEWDSMVVERLRAVAQEIETNGSDFVTDLPRYYGSKNVVVGVSKDRPTTPSAHGKEFLKKEISLIEISARPTIRLRSDSPLIRYIS